MVYICIESKRKLISGEFIDEEVESLVYHEPFDASVAAARGLGTFIGESIVDSFKEKKSAPQTQTKAKYGQATEVHDEEPEFKAYREQNEHEAYDFGEYGSGHGRPPQCPYFGQDMEFPEDDEAAGAHPADHRAAPAPTPAGAAAHDASLASTESSSTYWSKAASSYKIISTDELRSWDKR